MSINRKSTSMQSMNEKCIHKKCSQKKSISNLSTTLRVSGARSPKILPGSSHGKRYSTDQTRLTIAGSKAVN